MEYNNAFLINARDTGAESLYRLFFSVADHRARGNRWKAAAAARARTSHEDREFRVHIHFARLVRLRLHITAFIYDCYTHKHNLLFIIYITHSDSGVIYWLICPSK